MIDQRLILNFSASKLAVYANSQEAYHDKWVETQDYCIPLAYGTASFAVNTEQHDGLTYSFKYFFEPKSPLAGRIEILSYPDKVASTAQLNLGFP